MRHRLRGQGFLRAASLDAEFAAQLRAASRVCLAAFVLWSDLNDADDIIQQTTFILWKKYSQFDRHRSFFAWACGVARFEVANFLHTRSRHQLYFSDQLNLLLIEAQTEVEEADLEERRDALSRCVAKLRDRDRGLLHECYDDPSSIHGAADRRGRSPQSIYNSLRRIRRSLFECINRTLAQESRSG